MAQMKGIAVSELYNELDRSIGSKLFFPEVQ
jgi:hypothetical protein